MFTDNQLSIISLLLEGHDSAYKIWKNSPGGTAYKDVRARLIKLEEQGIVKSKSVEHNGRNSKIVKIDHYAVNTEITLQIHKLNKIKEQLEKKK